MCRGELQQAKNLEEERARLIQEYSDTFATPFRAAELGYIDEVISPEEYPAETSPALEMLQNKRDRMPPKKHGNIPL